MTRVNSLRIYVRLGLHIVNSMEFRATERLRCVKQIRDGSIDLQIVRPITVS